jgi:hypothetical protein
VLAFLVFGVLCLHSTVFSQSCDSLPVITTQPQPQTAFVGASLNLRIGAVSTSALRYTWQFNGTNLPRPFPGQGTPLLRLENVSVSNAGPYSVIVSSVIVSNSCGALTSQTAIVSINNVFGFGFAYANLCVGPGLSVFTSPFADSDLTVESQVPNPPDGASLFRVDGNGFAANNFLDGWSDPEMLLAPGQGWFFSNPASIPFTLTLVGTVFEGMLTNHLQAGYSLCASLVPQAGLLSSQLGFPLTPGSQVFVWDSLAQNYSRYDSIDYGWDPQEPSIQIARAFWVNEPDDQDWIREFSANGNYPARGSYRIVQPVIASETAEINFFTWHPDGISGRVFDFDGVTPLGTNFSGQLYAATKETEEALMPIGTPVSFLSGPGAGYIRAATIKLPGVRGGETVYLQLRAWETCLGATYEAAVANGSPSARSVLFSGVAHAPIEQGLPGLPPPNANGFPPIQLSIPDTTPVRIATVRSSHGAAEICFATRPGAIYCLLKASECVEGAAWSPVPSYGQIIGTGHGARAFDAIVEQSFYRLCRLQ